MPTPLQQPSSALQSFFAARSRSLRFPHDGILGQSAQAKGAAMNATIGIALEDDGLPMHLQSLARNVRLPPSEVFPYAGSFGVPALREAWKRHIQQRNPSLQADCSLPVVASGITHALAIATHLFADATCPVLAPSPGWDNYRLIVETSGARMIPYAVFDRSDVFDVSGLQAAIQGVDRACVLLNFPLNPTGTVPTRDQAHALVNVLRAAAERGAVLVTIVDDAYAGFVFEEDAYRESLFALLSDCHPNILAVKADGASKEDFAWGLRVAFLTYAGKALSSEDLRILEDATAAIVRATTSNACLLSQQLLLHGYQSPTIEGERAKGLAVLRRRFQIATTAARRPEYADAFSLLPCQGGYFLCLRPSPLVSAEAIRLALLRDEGVGIIAIDGLLRIAFSSLADADIERVFERIHRTCLRLLPVAA